MGRQLFTEYRKSIKRMDHGGPHNEDGSRTEEVDDKTEETKVENFSGDWYSHIAAGGRGAFPRMKYNNESGNYPNLNLSKAGFMSLSMAQFFGYENPIAMTSGERLGYDQWRVMKEYQYPQDMGLYPREFRNVVKDSVKVHGFDTEEGDTAVINYIENIYSEYELGNITLGELKKKVGSHITGDAGDFTGAFRKWLTSKKSKAYRNIFYIRPFN